jgi:hypothetical protein
MTTIGTIIINIMIVTIVTMIVKEEEKEERKKRTDYVKLDIKLDHICGLNRKPCQVLTSARIKAVRAVIINKSSFNKQLEIR